MQSSNVKSLIGKPPHAQVDVRRASFEIIDAFFFNVGLVLSIFWDTPGF